MNNIPNNYNFNKEDFKVSSPSTRDSESVQAKVNNLAGHAIKLLEGISAEFEAIGTRNLEPIKNSANHLIREVGQEWIQKAEQEQLSKADIKELKEAQLEKQYAKIIQQFNRNVSAFSVDQTYKEQGFTEKQSKKIGRRVQTYIDGGIKKYLIRLTPSGRKAVRTFRLLEKNLSALTQSNIQTNRKGSHLDQAITQEFNSEPKKILAKRAGVVALRNGITRVQVSFDEKKQVKQLKSMTAQVLSNEVRTTLNKKVILPYNKEALVRMTPLNREFDQSMNDGDTSFGDLVGNSGISSANRSEPHVINGWRTEMLDNQGNTQFQAIRHGCLADKFEKNEKKREATSKTMARELIETALRSHIATTGIDLNNPPDPITLEFLSTSLMTPDVIRGVGKHGADEKTMLKDQIEALLSFNGAQTFKIGDKEVNVHLNIYTFNFGVNAGAVGKMKKAPGVKFGHDNQYKYNKESWGRMKPQLNGLMQMFKKQDDPYKTQINELLKDVDFLLSTKSQYLDGGNQYEVGAKLMIAMNLLENAAKTDQIPKEHALGFISAFNCMSGKDRTGIMDGMVKAMMSYSLEGKKIPSHEELKTDENARKDLAKRFVNFLLQGGGIEITELNTATRGYKVKDEANIYGEIALKIFQELMGLSSTTSG